MTTGLNKKRGTFPLDNPYDQLYPNLELDPAQFNAMIYSFGTMGRHEKVAICPNYNGNLGSGEHALDCKICENGFVHFDPTDMVMFLSTNEMVKSFLRAGWWEQGTAFLSTPSFTPEGEDNNVYMNSFDRITMLNVEDPMIELIHKSDGMIDKLKYKAIKVEYLATKTKVYTEDNQFKLNENGDILWLSNDKPGRDLVTGLGEIFTIRYLYRPVWRVLRMMHEGRYSNLSMQRKSRQPVRFPQQSLIKKDFLVTKKDFQGNEVIGSLLP